MCALHEQYIISIYHPSLSNCLFVVGQWACRQEISPTGTPSVREVKATMIKNKNITRSLGIHNIVL